MHRRRLLLALFAVAYGTNVSTPLLLLYQDLLDLSAWTVTALFAAYPIGLIPGVVARRTRIRPARTKARSRFRSSCCPGSHP
jgi:MFS family permease